MTRPTVSLVRTPPPTFLLYRGAGFYALAAAQLAAGATLIVAAPLVPIADARRAMLGVGVLLLVEPAVITLMCAWWGASALWHRHVAPRDAEAVLCDGCGYDMRYCSDRCSECGRAMTSWQRTMAAWSTGRQWRPFDRKQHP